jgi:hypothetical protein
MNEDTRSALLDNLQSDRYFFDLIFGRLKHNLELCIWHHTVQNSQMIVGILAVSKMGDCVGFAVV